MKPVARTLVSTLFPRQMIESSPPRSATLLVGRTPRSAAGPLAGFWRLSTTADESVDHTLRRAQ
jgi:hypothetical protein